MENVSFKFDVGGVESFDAGHCVSLTFPGDAHLDFERTEPSAISIRVLFGDGNAGLFVQMQSGSLKGKSALKTPSPAYYSGSDFLTSRTTMSKTYTGEQFVKALSAGSLKEGIALTGVASLADNDAAAILFSEDMSCSNWVKIPIKIVESVQHIGTISCGEHSHPLITISLREPPQEDVVSTALADLLRNRFLPVKGQITQTVIHYSAGSRYVTNNRG